MKIISIANQKGGVGKSTVTINLAYELANKGLNILILDMDQQANTSEFFNLSQTDYNIYQVLKGRKRLLDCIIQVKPNISIVPGSRQMQYFNNENSSLLKKALKRANISDTYDIVLIDNPPAISNVTLNSFVVSDGVLIVTEPEAFSISGLSLLNQNINSINSTYRQPLTIVGILVNKVDSRRSVCVDNIDLIKKQYGNLMLNTPLNNYFEVTRSIQEKQFISELFPDSKSSNQFKDVADELLLRI